MKIPLQSFEQHIDETILKRGFQYFKKGLVSEPEEIGHGEYEAIVEGTEDYTVRITLKNEVITEFVCTCPYDHGPICKHVVALIFHLQQHELDLTAKPKKAKKDAKKAPKRKTISEQIDEILEKLTPQELKGFVKAQSARDGKFRQLFLANHLHLIMPESKALYSKQVKAILKSSTDRSGYIDYSKTRFVGNAVYQLIETAETQVEQSNFKTAFHIACAVLEEMTKALDYADDSNGDIGGCIDPAIDIIYALVNKSVSDELRGELFNYCTNAWSNGLFMGWDWHFTMLEVASRLVKDKYEAERVHLLLDDIKSSGKSWDWDFEKAQQIRALLIKQTEGEEKAVQYMEQNISNDDFRKEVIEKAISEKDYTKAIALAEEGLIINSIEGPGLLDNWSEYLLQVSLLQNDKANILKHARRQFISSNREKKQYFELLKKHTEPSQWEASIKGIIKDLTKKDRWNDNYLVSQIYVWEEKWDELLNVIKLNASLHNIENYEKYLIKDYADEISDLYQTAILEYMQNNLGRDHYQTACRYLRRMIKMGARDKANYVIKILKTLYPKRTALMEELKRV